MAVLPIDYLFELNLCDSPTLRVGTCGQHVVLEAETDTGGLRLENGRLVIEPSSHLSPDHARKIAGYLIEAANRIESGNP